MKKIILIILPFLFSNIINGQCLGSQSYTLSPAGPYTAGQNITVTYTLNNFIQTNSNWIIAFDIDYGNGWSNINPVSTPGNPGGSSGTWIWDTQNTYPSGLNFGPGYRFQNSSWFNPDWGTSSTGPFTLSFNLQVENSCVNNDLSIDISVIGDCQTGGWNNGACCSIIPFNIYNGTSTGNSTSNTTALTECDSYLWSVDGTTYTTSGAYTDVSTNAAGCTHTETLNLTIDNSTTSTDPQTACDSYTWIDGNTYTASNNSATFTSTNAAGCDNVATLNLIINNSTTSTDPQTACDSYTWIDGNTYTASNNSATFTSTNAAGCTHTKTLNLVVGYSNQLDLIIAENHISCFGYNDGSITLIPNGGTPPFQYSWDNGVVSQSISALSAGDYSFSFTDANGCALDSLANINEANQIFLDFIATSPICRYDESTLSIHISNSNFNSYTVSLQDSALKSYTIDTNGLLIASGLPIILTPNFSCNPQIISLTDENGCTAILNDNVHIEVKQLPVLEINEPDICIGTPTFILDNAIPIGGAYQVDGIGTNLFDASNLNPGHYNINYSYTDPITSCSNQTTEILTISESPRADMLFSPQPTDIDNPTIFFRDNSNEMVLYSEWNLGDGTIINDEMNFWHTYADTGTYTIKYYITNMYECTDSVIKDLIINPIYLTFIPDAFSPNNDGDNDYFSPSIIGGNSYNMKIYNRWGEIVYNEDDGIWDGKINNNTVQHGLYSYSILVNDFKNKPFIYTGTVTLIK